MAGRHPVLRETTEGMARMELRLPIELKRAVVHEATEQGKPVWQVVVEALEGHEPLQKWLPKEGET